MARLIDLPPEYVSGGRYLAAAPSIEERSYKVESAMGDVKRILEFAETVGKSPLTGLAIKGIAKLYEMGQPSLADLQAQEAKLRMALEAEGKTAAEIEEEIAALKKTSAALEKAYAVTEGEVAADIAVFRAPGTTAEQTEYLIQQVRDGAIGSEELYRLGWSDDEVSQVMRAAGKWADPAAVRERLADVGPSPMDYMGRSPSDPRYATPTIRRADSASVRERMAGFKDDDTSYEPFTPDPVGVDAIPTVEEPTSLPATPKAMPTPDEIEEVYRRRGVPTGGGGDVYEDPRLTELHQKQADVQRKIQAFQAERQAVAEAQRAKQAEIEAVQTQIAEVPTFRGQQMRTMDDIVAVASTASKEERGALLVAARNLATPSNLFDFDYKQDAMKKVTELFPTALDLRRESLTSTELRKTIATEKRADAAMIKALKEDDLLALKKDQLEKRIALLAQDLRREPERLEKIRQQIENLKARTMASAAGTKFREAALEYKERRMNLTQLKTFKQPIERIYLDQVKGLTTEINTWEKTKARASLNMTSLSDELAAGLSAEDEAKIKHEANQALKAYRNASTNITALRLARTKVTSIAHQIGKANSIEEVNAFITEHGAH